MIDYVWILPALMAVTALVIGLGVRRLGATAGLLATGAMALTFVFSVALFFDLQGHLREAEQRALAEGLPKAQVLESLFIRANEADPAATTVREGMGGYVHLWTWFAIDGVTGAERSLRVDFAFHVDQLTVIFLLFISFVGTLVFIYANGYLREHHGDKLVPEPGFARFFCYLALFAASMYVLVLGANLPVLFIGWEGVGLCSYLLIGYYYDRQFRPGLSCTDAGTKAFVVNRIGDLGILLGMFLLFWGTGTLDIQEIIQVLLVGNVSEGFLYGGAVLTAATLLLFLGATGKSAQIPLFTWLPDAMAGPTPVSALIHAATMVTAGVYLLARFNPAFMLTPDTMLVIAIVGGLTAFVAAAAAVYQRRLKSILAYSTVSQLGFMFLAMGVGAFAAGIFHVFTHAFFKAALFLAAGSVIFALHHEEDVYKMGGLRKKLPKTWLAYLAGTLAIAGIIPFAGFFSKDEILYMTFLAGVAAGPVYTLLYILALITAGLTAFYMGRSLLLVFHGETRLGKGGDHKEHHHGDDDHGHHEVRFEEVKESPSPMTSVLLVLAVCSALVGLLNVPKLLIPLGDKNEIFHHYVEPVTDQGALAMAQLFGNRVESAPKGPLVVGLNPDAPELFIDPAELTLFGVLPAAQGIAIISLLVAISGLGLAWAIYGSGLSSERRLARGGVGKVVYTISSKAWGWDQLYDLLFVRGSMRLYRSLRSFDEVFVRGLMVGGAVGVCRFVGLRLRLLQNGQVQVYGVVMVLGLCLFLLIIAVALYTLAAQDAALAEATASVLQSQPVAEGSSL